MDLIELAKQGKVYCNKLRKIINMEDCELEKEQDEKDNNQEANKE
jgi:hypothetical protein